MRNELAMLTAEADVRIETIVNVDTMLAGCECPERDLLDWGENTEMLSTLQDAGFEIPEDFTYDELADEALRTFGRGGWVIEAATPVLQSTGTSLSSSWGNYWTRWFYAETFEQAVHAAVAWAHAEYHKAKATVA